MNTLTGVPIDVFLSVLSGLGGLVYFDVIRRLGTLHKDGVRRAKIQDHMQSYQRLICDKLGIEYTDPPED